MAADFQAVAQAALSMALALLPQWLGGKREGREWVGARKANGGPGDSWKINLETGEWGAFATDERGGDMISLYAALHHVSQTTALHAVAQLTGMNGNSYVPVLLHTKPPEKAPDEIPADAPPLPDHRTLGPATAIYAYGDSFRVARYEGPEGKEFKQFTWRENRWMFKGAPAPLELYNKVYLENRPAAPVLIVEGEKCADAAAPLLPEYVVVTWAGGASNWKKSDWALLAGRHVTLWPDADDPGRKAAAAIAGVLLPIAASVRVITPHEEAPPGWDVADAIAEATTDTADLIGYIDAHASSIEAPAPAPVPKALPARAPTKAPAPLIEMGDDESSIVVWHSLGLLLNQSGEPHATMANASQIIQLHQRLKGRIWYDTFRQKIYHRLHDAELPWTDADTGNLTVMMQQTMRLPKMVTRIVAEGLDHAARKNARNSLTDWLDGLAWDGMPRLHTWLIDCLGCDMDEYTMAISRNWPIAMVARAYHPGCQMDNMPVLEGVSGIAKTTFLRVLGDPWYKSFPHLGFGEKDFLQAIQGAWLIEIPDMTNFSRREHSQIIATITTTHDCYRASYGRITEDHPRTAIFAATSETDDYLSDARGKRRYWPIRCGTAGKIDIDGLRETREQIFAEAVQAYRDGATWYKMPGQATIEQDARVAEPDAWIDPVLDYAARSTEKLTIPHILRDAIHMELARQTSADTKRVARILKGGGWYPTTDGKKRYWKRLP
jgi:predicted P-loop ATPase